jgi:hypothetical protein
MSTMMRLLDSRARNALAGAFAMALVVTWSQRVGAQQFDLNAYQALADADSSETVAVGTVITVKNWQKYRKFFGIGEQALYSGKYQFHIGDGPDYEVKVGPITHFKEPTQLSSDTEKYGSQTRLEPTAGGSYTIKNWVAGWPFPNPQEPQRAYKVYFDGWGSYIPEIYFFKSGSPNGDRYYNHNSTYVDLANYRLTHRSDPGVPINFPDNQGLLLSQYIFVTAPEQSKYTTSLTMQYEDPNKLNEVYVFLPSLRRALRLSSAARCAPILGSDYLNDDNTNGLSLVVSNFRMDYLGEKKILAIVNGKVGSDATHDSANATITQHAPLGGWPVGRLLGDWEVRKVHVIRITPIPDLAGHAYCYSNAVIYLDAEFYLPLTRETYDVGGKLWKVQVLSYVPTKVYDGFMPINSYSSDGSIIDLQNLHYSVSALYEKSIGMNQVPKKYQDIGVKAFPKGLAQIMQ